MLGKTRGGRSVGIALPLSAVLLIALLASTGPALAHGAAAVAHAGASKGVLTPVARVDPRTLTNDAAGASLARGARPLRTASKATALAREAGHIPSAASTAVSPARAGALLTNFDGVGSRDSAKTNFGAEFEPPDQGLCVGNGFVLEPVNSAYTIYRTDGSVVAGPFNVNKLFDEGFRQFTSDPRCYFDKATNTWFAIILFINAPFTRARTDIAVNPSGDPTTPWTVYHLDATDDGSNGTPSHPGCPCLGDQPLLGIDAVNLYISTNEFSILGPEFNGAQIYALPKAELVALAQHVHFVHFDNLSIGGAVAASVQPAITNGSPAAEYFLNSLDPFGTFDNRLGVWAMTNRQVVSQGGIPTLTSVVITSEPYGVPPNAEQQGSTSLLNTGDDRMQQVQFIDGTLWGALDTAVTIPNDTAARSGAAWFRVVPKLQGNVIGSANLVGQGYVAAMGNYLLYPAIQVSHGGVAAMVLTFSGANSFASAAYTVMGARQSSFGVIQIAASGTGPYDPDAGRWGDYSWATLDPSGGSFWMATEYIPPKASQTKNGLRNWGTRVIQVAAN
ncbi:MAG: hypothetical protein OJF49_002936 [Ktedonobacterales bacterium]|jgi:hypothetical protein|nr:MAG: hypothetical protein OJF49_002936 [Ktedonobacterales bacterium]